MLRQRRKAWRDAGKGPAHLLAGSLVVMLALATPAQAEETFFDGLAAFDGGDLAETARIWRNLADAGDANAQVGLAGLHLAGNGVPRDSVEAARLYRLAAEQGDSNGQLNLGRLHLDGIGVQQDKAAAYAWFTLAANQGRRWAEDKRSELEPTLSDAERTEAETLIASIENR
ncbi:MAG: tetratricopeptide repeat protein [Geminicoccaceae bacterium]